MSRAKWLPICDLTKCECNFGGMKNFNYGFMRGTEDACSHPKLGGGKQAMYTWGGKAKFDCPLGLPAKGGEA